MAIKDWKKVGTNMWRNKKYDTIRIDEFKHFAGRSRVEIDRGYIILINDREKNKFKTKSQALKFARAYMRNH